MAKPLSNLIVFARGKKVEIRDPSKVIIAVRDDKLVQHQASIDVTIPNITELKKIVRRGP